MKDGTVRIMKALLNLTPRIAVGALLILMVWGCGSIPQLKEGSEGAYVRLPFVRVLIDNSSPEMTIEGGSSFTLECLKGDKCVVYHASRSVSFVQDDGMIRILMAKRGIGDRFDEVIITPRGMKGLLNYRANRYRGMMKVLPNGVNLELINIVHMDDYLKGVVPPEIGFTGESEFEAIKAQAVAARTYSMSRLSQYSDEEFDMRSDVTDQVYSGVEAEKSLVSKAIDDTRGYVIKYDDKLINAYYHSTCGGYTDDINEVWEKPAAPYLRAVKDSNYCNWSKYYNWTESYTAQQLKMRIEQYLSADRGREIKIGDILDIYVRTQTAGGRVAELVVRTADGDFSFGKDRIRWVFKRSSNPELILESARFRIETTHDDSGKLMRADFMGGGYGHGVGMCQCGAIGMSRDGKKFNDILATYYRNTELSRLY